MKPMKTCQHAGLLIAGLAMPMSAQAAGAGLPQLDISTWPSQLFWLVVLFTAGYILMAKFVTPRIGSVLEERRAKLDEDLGKARSASEDAARIRAEYEADLDAARSAAAETAKQAAAEATKQAEASDAKIAKKLAEKVAKAEAKLATARSEAMANLNNVAAEAALAAVAQLANIQTTAAQAGKTADKLATQMAKQEAN
ncbi:MAG: F0F1 ATP synthase subunit B' [Candidatus Puniceispirillaceae bacterium]|jgi:F-type H+-transporting ATPase subunit b